jgi:SagB-type dehydrogenase family enzyme
MLRIDGNSGGLQFDNMMQKGIIGTQDWTEYSVTLPLPEAAKMIYIGAILSGKGILWIDDFQILIDGKDISKAKLKSEKTVVNPNNTKEELDPKEVIYLPEPQLDGSISVEKSLCNRRSRRNFQDTAISLENLSQILWAAYGITFPITEYDFLRGGLRTAPSAGGLYPLDIYVAVGKVNGLTSGVYKYVPKGHKIIRIIDGDIRTELCSAALGQQMVKEAPISLIYTAVFSRTTGKYGQRGRERYVCMDLGHSAENVYLQVESLGLGTCVAAAFLDDELSLVLQLPKEEEPLYIMPIGYYGN